MDRRQELRKNEHVAIAKKYYHQERESGFSDFRFVHHSLVGGRLDQIDLSNAWGDFPLYINAMTGGSERTKDINEALAIVARDSQLPMALGSMSVALKTGQSDSFTIARQVNPDGILLANIGANHSYENGQQVVDLLKADGLQVHLNAPQEAVMPEGDEDFSMWRDNLQGMVEEIDVPVIAKEVGYGMSKESIQELLDLGVQAIDVGGRGGTDFNQIEDERRYFKYTDLHQWGQTTPLSLMEAREIQDRPFTLLASGGVRTPLDLVTCLALGAESVGMAAPFLVSVMEDGIDATLEWLENFKEEVYDICLMLGASSIQDLREKTQIVVTGYSREWCIARGIDYTSLARR